MFIKLYEGIVIPKWGFFAHIYQEPFRNERYKSYQRKDLIAPMSRAIGSRYTVESSPQISDYHNAVKDVIDSVEVLKLKEFAHHRCMTRFQHCLNVSYYSFLMCRRLGLNADQAARAGLLHDLYEDCPKCTRRHLVDHPEKALENALESFKLTKVEQDIIVKHMWPIRKGLPKYPESMVVMLTDKYIALIEFCIYLKRSAQERTQERRSRRAERRL